MVERPELFAAVSQVPMASAVRAEFQQNGPVTTVEFGTIRDPQGFRNLLAMDAYLAIEDSRIYPAIIFTTGLNDTRVDKVNRRTRTHLAGRTKRNELDTLLPWNWAQNSQTLVLSSA